MTLPNPGSRRAVEQGCMCPVLDNNRGDGFPYPRDDGRDPGEFPSFYISDRCPLHSGDVSWKN